MPHCPCPCLYAPLCRLTSLRPTQHAPWTTTHTPRWKVRIAALLGGLWGMVGHAGAQALPCGGHCWGGAWAAALSQTPPIRSSTHAPTHPPKCSCRGEAGAGCQRAGRACHMCAAALGHLWRVRHTAGAHHSARFCRLKRSYHLLWCACMHVSAMLPCCVQRSKAGPTTCDCGCHRWVAWPLPRQVWLP